MAVDDVKTVPTTHSTTQGSVQEGQAIREIPDLLRALSEDELNTAKRKLVRKLDSRLMAPLILMYIMNYLDRYDALD